MINFVVALYAEAKPIIDHFGLKKVQTWQPFPTYLLQDYRLIISGIGRCNSAAATTWLASITDTTKNRKDDVWINLGIAGHKNEVLGKIMCCHKITEQSTQKSWYPVQINLSLNSSNLVTLDQVSTDYTEDSLYDMEASGFYASALRFSTSELTQCLKIVSDNDQNSIEKINKELVQELISDNLSVIKKTAHHLMELSFDSLPPDTRRTEKFITEKWKFTVTQTRQLQRLLQRYYIIAGEPTPLLAELQLRNITRASQVLDLFHHELKQRPTEIS